MQLCPSIATIVSLQAELKESNEQGAEIGEAESTIAEVEAVVKPTEEWILNSQVSIAELLASILIDLVETLWAR